MKRKQKESFRFYVKDVIVIVGTQRQITKDKCRFSFNCLVLVYAFLKN